MSVMGWIAIVAGALVVAFVIQLVHLALVLAWEDQRTRGLGYYGLPADGRERFKRTLRRHAMLLFPVIRLLGRFSRFDFSKVTFVHRDLPGPKGSCGPESFERADLYQVRPEDVFVVTQMKCGTTWMQHVVYEVLHRGNGNLVDTGTALYAVSPWLEARKSVAVEDAPLLGSERPSRVIKTHMPADRCPYRAEARFIYVARHPVSCFASCADFIATTAGAFGPALPVVETWFCSDHAMWWRTWPAHVAGWWNLSQRRDNVLFVRFEDMKRDLADVVCRVADFLSMHPLTPEEVDRVVTKCSFDYMQRHKGAFEMQPPNLLAIDATLFVRGTANRHDDVPDDVRRRVMTWCATEMDKRGLPLERLYPASPEETSASGWDAARPAPR